MRLTHLRAAVFGPLRGVELSLDQGFVVIHGANESGKSSFRMALETVLYGFEPASRDNHPLVDWWDESPPDLHLEAELRLGTGIEQAVERVLQASGKLREARGGTGFSGSRRGNIPLEVVRNLPRGVYGALYSVELEELTALEGDVRAHVDNLLMPATPELGMRPTHEVLSEINHDHHKLWRPDKRGKPEAAALQQEIAKARSSVTAARDEEAELREKRIRQSQLVEELASLREQRQRLTEQAAQAPYLKQLAELRQRQAQSGTPPDLNALRGNPLNDPTELRDELARVEERLRPAKERLARAEVEISKTDQRVLDNASEVELAIAEDTPRPGQDVDSLREDVKTLRNQARRQLENLLSEPITQAVFERTQALPLDVLRAAQARWAEEWEGQAQAPPVSSTRIPAWGIGAAIAGPCFAALGVALGLDDVWLLTGIGSFVLLFLGALALRRRQSPEPREQPRLPESCHRALGDLTLDEELLATPSGLMRAIESLQSAQANIEDFCEYETQLESAGALAEQRTQRLLGLCERLEIHSRGETALLVARLQEAMEKARHCAILKTRDTEERESAEQTLSDLQPSAETARERLDRVEQVLTQNEPDSTDFTDAFRRVQARLEEHRYLQTREEELKRDPRWQTLSHHPSLENPATLLDPAHANDDASSAAALSTLDERIEAGSNEAGALAEALGADPGGTLASAEESVADLETQLLAVQHGRDRLALLERVLTVAEREMREQHQPDVLRRAGEHLSRLTGGRYTRLDDSGSGDGKLQVLDASNDQTLTAGPPLSSGTLDQIQLCLRLGLLDHLDADGERLPLVLDDALLRMDDQRRAAAISLLSEISQQRQVFLLTCHDQIASEIEQSLGIRRTRLDSTHQSASWDGR
ncbi:AAA family ATPase [Myxococcota bacterium]|nr:AAA family ATPase [Myxococcota bacterium]